MGYRWFQLFSSEKKPKFGWLSGVYHQL